jgi:glycosyltransferase involved in cell wall biosynthesis
MRVLFTTEILEHPPAGGPQLRIENSIKALSRVADLWIVARTATQLIGGKAAEDYFRQYCREFDYAPSGNRLFGNRILRKLQRSWRKLRGVDIDADTQFIVDYVRARQIDVIWFGYGNISFPLIRRIKARMPEIPVVCDTDSVWSRFVLRELPYQRNPIRRWYVAARGRRKEREERVWVNLCEVTTAVSEVDAEYYRSLATDPQRVRIFSNVIDLNSYANAPAPAQDIRKPCIYLAGTFGHYHSPMDVAARWVLTEILPKVRAAIPKVNFYIVGRDSDRTLGHLREPHVSVLGKLPSVLPYLCYADVSLVPLKFESGTRFKILEAAACGVPIVSTTLGAEGLPVIDGQHVLIADDAEQFAGAIIRLLNNRLLAQTLAGNCRELVRRSFSVDRLEEEARDILGYLSHA